MADLLARTERIRFFPDVANLPLRSPAMMAKQAASFDTLSGGRFELALGAGAFWEPIGAMGGPVRSGGEALKALAEAIHIVRAAGRGPSR
jgi:alkanesulfonate monooxygenase SsuD/methylene tetrahydromethanopterin reductase-like flavin-dependent oxidoreductase (luciferase family)